MAEKLPVQALERGYYGGKVREPGESFVIKKIKELGSWMMPVGWDVSDSGKPKLTKEAKEELKAIDDQDPDDEDEDDDGVEINVAQAVTFRGAKETYGPPEMEIAITDALERAVSEFGHGVEKWNELEEKDRKARIMSAVKDIVNAAQADAA